MQIPKGNTAARTALSLSSTDRLQFFDTDLNVLFLWDGTVWSNSLSNKQDVLVSGTNIKTVAGVTLLGAGDLPITKSTVDLDNVDNTSDSNKPISTATQTALDAKQDTLISGTNIRTVNGQTLLGSTDLVIAGGTNFQIIQSGATYPAPTTEQLTSRITFVGYNYPPDIRIGIDKWEQTISPVFQTAITDISANGLRINWNVPTYLNRPTVLNPSGLSVNAEVFDYIYEVATDVNFDNIVVADTTANTTVVVAGLSPLTTYYTRIFHGILEQAEGIYSNIETVATTELLTIYDNAVALSPQYAYDLRPVTIGATSVPNDGSLSAIVMEKSGAFTKNNGLISVDGTSLLRINFASLIKTGHSATGGVDWIWLKCLDADGGTSGQNPIALYRTASRFSSRIRYGITSIVGQLTVSGQPLTGTSIGVQNYDTISGEKVHMITKIGDVLNFYQKGSDIPVQTYNMVTDQDFETDLLTWFENATGTPNSNIEAVYTVFAYGTVGGTEISANESAWKELMLLTNN